MSRLFPQRMLRDILLLVFLASQRCLADDDVAQVASTRTGSDLSNPVNTDLLPNNYFPLPDTKHPSIPDQVRALRQSNAMPPVLSMHVQSQHWIGSPCMITDQAHPLGSDLHVGLMGGRIPSDWRFSQHQAAGPTQVRRVVGKRFMYVALSWSTNSCLSTLRSIHTPKHPSTVCSDMRALCDMESRPHRSRPLPMDLSTILSTSTHM